MDKTYIYQNSISLYYNIAIFFRKHCDIYTSRDVKRKKKDNVENVAGQFYRLRKLLMVPARATNK